MAEPGTAATTTRERILDVALDLFVRKGYAETSLREIAAELGFTKAALYYHFESKQDILITLHMRVHELTDAVLLQGGAAEDGTWEQLVEGLIGPALQNRRLIELHMRNADAIGELHTGAGLEKHGQIQEIEDPLFGVLRDPAVPVERRVRRLASLGAIGSVLLGAHMLADVPDAELERVLRDVVGEVMKGRSS
jgi:AcrR family transcriptional regulator